MCFFLNFPNAWGILAQRVYNAHTIFRQFSGVKDGGWYQQQSIFSQFVSGDPQHRPKEG